MTTLNQILGAGKPRAAQLNIPDIFNFADALGQRGFTGIVDGSVEATLVSNEASDFFAADVPSLKRQTHDFLTAFASKDFRTRLRKHIFEGSVAPTQDELAGLRFDNIRAMQQRYGKTFELLLAYLCIKELGALSAGFGVTIDEAPQGGDFDCVASFRDMLLYLEVKSGERLKREHIATFVARHSFLHAELSILFVDFNGIDENIIRSAKGIGIYETYAIDHIRKLERNGTVFYTLEPDVIIVDLHRNGNVIANLRSVLRYYWGYRSLVQRIDYEMVDPGVLGYAVTVLAGAEGDFSDNSSTRSQPARP